jgi:ubiquinone/menaquinone biosynthesis C-methylase UbiE
MERLEGATELLDGPLDDPGALRANLRDLRRINRLTGGVGLSLRAIDALVPGTAELALLDVGTGGADIPLAILTDSARRGRRAHVTAVDNRSEVLEAAQAERPSLRRSDGLTLGLADGTALHHRDDSFDVAHSSLTLHHLEPSEAMAFLAELARVARFGVVINDLSRGRAFVAGAWLLTRLMTRCRYTRNDGPLSVRRAYTVTEARRLVVEAGLDPVFEAQAAFGHRWAIAAVRSP